MVTLRKIERDITLASTAILRFQQNQRNTLFYNTITILIPSGILSIHSIHKAKIALFMVNPLLDVYI